MDDVRAVLDAVDAGSAVLWSGHEGTRLAILFAATYPERTRALVLYDPTARGLWAPDYPWAPTEDEWLGKLAEVRAQWGDRDYLRSGHATTVHLPPRTRSSSTGTSGT